MIQRHMKSFGVLVVTLALVACETLSSNRTVGLLPPLPAKPTTFSGGNGSSYKTAIVYIFGVAAASATPTLLYQTPDLRTYDVKWEVIGWDVVRRTVILEKAVKREIQGKITHERVLARIGTKPLKLEDIE